MSIQGLERAKVVRVDRYEFELNDGSVYRHPEPLDTDFTVQEFQVIYETLLRKNGQASSMRVTSPIHKCSGFKPAHFLEVDSDDRCYNSVLELLNGSNFNDSSVSNLPQKIGRASSLDVSVISLQVEAIKPALFFRIRLRRRSAERRKQSSKKKGNHITDLKPNLPEAT